MDQRNSPTPKKSLRYSQAIDNDDYDRMVVTIPVECSVFQRELSRNRMEKWKCNSKI